MPEQSNSETPNVRPSVESSADQLERDAATFISSGSKEAAERLLDHVKDISDHGPEYVKDVFNQVKSDSDSWKTLTAAHVSTKGDFITFQANVAADYLGMNSRTISAHTGGNRVIVGGQTDRNHMVGVGRKVLLEKLKEPSHRR